MAPQDKSLLRSETMKIVAIYSLASGLWIFLSDSFLALFFRDPIIISRLSMYKGFLFVILTATLLYVLISRYIKRIDNQITEVTQAQQNMAYQKMLLDVVIEGTTDAIYVKDTAGRYLLANSAVVHFVNKPLEEIIGQDDRSLFPADNARTLMQKDTWIMTQSTPHTFEECLTTPEGEKFFSTTKGPVRNESGEVTGLFGIARDTTESKQSEIARNKSEQNFRAIIEFSPLPLALNDDDGNITYVNRAFEQIIGYTGRDIPTVADWWPLAYPDKQYRQKIIDLWNTKLEEASRNHQPFAPMECNVVCKDGTQRIFMCSTVFLEQNTAGSHLVVFYDITERKRAEYEKNKLETQLQQAQKMESVGRLAGGIAHDFNNMLGVMLGHAELALMHIEPGHRVTADLKEICKAASRSADLTRQLLAFARKQTIAPKVLDLNETVSGMFKMMQRLIGEDIQLTWQPAANLWPVKMDASQLDQIMANLCVNARDAIDDIGRISIETRNSSIDATYCVDHVDVLPGEYVQLSVSDTGRGMDKETMAQIFEPFFTTKERGKGTGLGLSTIYGAVKQNNGFINVYSEPGRGTTFSIYLPRHAGSSSKEVEESLRIPDLQGGHETILLVEDEPDILNMTTMILELHGYSVLGTHSPGEALKVAREQRETIDLLMTDVIMPEMNGRDLAESVSVFCPDIKRLYMSGYTADIISHHGVLDEGVHFIQKPFTINTLASTIRNVLDGK